MPRPFSPDLRSATVSVPLTAELRDKVVKAATLERRPIANWIRHAIMAKLGVEPPLGDE